MATPHDQSQFLDPHQFLAADYKIELTMRALPAGLRHALQDKPMADPGKPFTVGCVGNDLPRARLIFAAFDRGQSPLSFAL